MDRIVKQLLANAIMSQTTRNYQHQATTLQNVTEWLKAVQAKHPDKLQHVTDDAILGLQSLHTAIIRAVMERVVEIQETEQGKKRKIPDIIQQVHSELGLTREWDQALVHQQEQAEVSQPTQPLVEGNKPGPAPSKMTKAQRKKARKQQAVDPKLLEEQEEMLRKSRERFLQQKEGKSE